ncbi:hypothetical protein [Pseudomonas sp. SDO5271_S396]
MNTVSSFVPTFATPYDNHRVNNRQLNNGKFEAHYTQGNEIPTAAPRSDTTSGVRPNNIWADFFQVTEGNCVTVSAIKAAMVKYGSHPRGIFEKVTRTDAGYEVLMRDNVSVFLTHQELQQAEAKAGWVGRGTVLQHAIFLYAASAKRAQNENNDAWAARSFDAAMQTLNDGEFPGEALRRLGLKDHFREGTVEALKNGAVGTLTDARHSVAVIDGYMDVWGTRKRLAGSSWESAPEALILT